MHLHTRIFAVALALFAWSLPAFASAQITFTYGTYGARGTPASGAANYLVNWPISQSECEANLPITFQITNAPFITGTRLVWALWQGGTGTAGANCETAINRRAMSGTVPVCTLTTWDGGEITTTMPTITVRPQELFPMGCGASGQGTYVFYALAVSARIDATTDVVAPAFFVFNIALDFTAPTAPMLSDAAGDRQIQLGWSNTTTEMLAGANVYVDRSASCDQTSTTLVAGGAVPASLTPVSTPLGSAPTSQTLDGMALGLSVGGSALVAVTVFDMARNESVFSNVACIERVTVAGFWDAYCAENMLTVTECDARYSGCTASPGQQRIGWLGWVGVAALLTAVGRRRVRGAR